MNILQRWKQTALHNKGLVLSSALVAFGTIFYAGAAAFQVCILKTTARQSSEQVNQLTMKAQGIVDAMNQALSDNRNALAEAFRQNKASLDAEQDQYKRSLKATIDQFHLDQRAWLGTREFHTVEFSKEKGLAVDIAFANSGKTPARDVEDAVEYILSSTAVAGPTTDQDKELIFDPAQAVAPQGILIVHLGWATPARAANRPSEYLGQQDIVSKFDLIDSQKEFLYYFGRLRYKDVFGNVRNTKFCLFLANPKTKELAYCDSFNDLD